MATSTLKMQGKKAELAAGYGTTSKSLSTSFAIMPVDNNYFIDSSCFQLASDGGYRCLKAGLVKIDSNITVSSVNTSDVVQMNVSVYRSGSWIWTGDSFMFDGTDYRTCTYGTQIREVQANDIVYMRVRNNTAARGSFTSGRLIVEYL